MFLNIKPKLIIYCLFFRNLIINHLFFSNFPNILTGKKMIYKTTFTPILYNMLKLLLWPLLKAVNKKEFYYCSNVLYPWDGLHVNQQQRNWRGNKALDILTFRIKRSLLLAHWFYFSLLLTHSRSIEALLKRVLYCPLAVESLALMHQS